jgi:rfaE bifunctional protein nucleotidyltransferase chain/domain/rfaE bifunctional protein kinase chain/domain
VSRGRLVVVGDALLDRDLVGSVDRVAPDAPVPVVDGAVERLRPGGAALAAYLAARDGHDVVLVTALGADATSARIRELLDPYLTVVPLPLLGTPPEKTRVLAGEHPVVRLDSGGDGGVGELPGATRRAVAAALDSATAILVADYGRGMAAQPELRALLTERCSRVPVVWDPHPRGPEPVPGVRLVTPNLAEARRFLPAVPAAAATGELREAETRAAALVRRWECTGVAVTLGSRGALLSFGEGHPLVAPAPKAHGADTCGAGDRFAAAAAALLAGGAVLSEAVLDAVQAAAVFVSEGGAGAVRIRRPGQRDRRTAPGGRPRSALDVVARARAAGRTVVATGGCFDLLHAGHVSTLEASRALGDCLVVCLNSDASVRRLKGPGRPLVPQGDRVRVLEALECVDGVAVFDEDTPEAVLSVLRPDVWAKGGDYAGAELPEAALLREWGGQIVVLPYVDGRSTTRLAEAAARSAGRTRTRTQQRPEGVRL